MKTEAEIRALLKAEYDRPSESVTGALVKQAVINTLIGVLNDEKKTDIERSRLTIVGAEPGWEPGANIY